jgi:hypothetical protein
VFLACLIIWKKPKDFSFIFPDDQFASTADTEEKQMISQEKEEEIYETCETYVVC